MDRRRVKEVVEGPENGGINLEEEHEEGVSYWLILILLILLVSFSRSSLWI